MGQQPQPPYTPGVPDEVTPADYRHAEADYGAAGTWGNYKGHFDERLAKYQEEHEQEEAVQPTPESEPLPYEGEHGLVVPEGTEASTVRYEDIGQYDTFVASAHPVVQWPTDAADAADATEGNTEPQQEGK